MKIKKIELRSKHESLGRKGLKSKDEKSENKDRKEEQIIRMIKKKKINKVMLNSKKK